MRREKDYTERTQPKSEEHKINRMKSSDFRRDRNIWEGLTIKFQKSADLSINKKKSEQLHKIKQKFQDARTNHKTQEQ